MNQPGVFVSGLETICLCSFVVVFSLPSCFTLGYNNEKKNPDLEYKQTLLSELKLIEAISAPNIFESLVIQGKY